MKNTTSFGKVRSNPTIRELTRIFLDFSKQRGWQKKYFPNQLAKALIIEAAELLEIFQRKDNRESRLLLRDSYIKQRLAYEIIDVLYYLLMIAWAADINISKALIEKLQQLEIRYPAKGTKKGGALGKSSKKNA